MKKGRKKKMGGGRMVFALCSGFIRPFGFKAEKKDLKKSDIHY